MWSRKQLKRSLRSGRQRIASDAWTELLATFTGQLRSNPELVAARNDLAVHLMERDPKRAIAEFQEAIKIDPHHPILWGNLAVEYAVQDQFAEAERIARVAASLDRTSLRPQILLGIALVEQHKYTPEALACLERA